MSAMASVLCKTYRLTWQQARALVLGDTLVPSMATPASQLEATCHIPPMVVGRPFTWTQRRRRERFPRTTEILPQNSIL